MQRLKTITVILSLFGLCIVSTAASAQGFDLGAAMDNKRSNTNSKRTRLNTALAPFYRGSLTTATVLKPEIEVSGDQVKAIYPVRLDIDKRKYQAAIGRLMKVLDSIGSRVQDPLKRPCSFRNGCEPKIRQYGDAKGARYYQLRELNHNVPHEYIRFYVNPRARPQTVQAWDVLKTDIDLPALNKYVKSAMILTVQLGTSDFTSQDRDTPNGPRPDIVSSQSVNAGRKAGRAVNGATLWGEVLFINPIPHTGSSSATWDINRPVVVRVPFSLEAAEAREVKGARAIIRPEHQYRGNTRKVR